MGKSSSSSSFIDIVGGKLIVVLLIIGIMATAISNVTTSLNNERLQEEAKKDLQRQATITRGQVAQHNNQTERALEIIEGNLKIQQPFLEKFNLHINQTATAAPVVLQLKPMLEENNKLLEQLLEALIINGNSSSSTSTSSNNSGEGQQ